MNKLDKQIISILYDTIHLDVDKEKLKPDTTLKELGISSLETISLILEFEEIFDISIDVEEMFTPKSIGDVSSFLSQKMSNKNLSKKDVVKR